MVGVPGRSKGCNTCIQRKVKCDGGQPACGNCRKSNRLCTGYKRPVAFVMSSNVALGSEAIEDTEGGTITTQGRWRKRTRRTPKALAQDPKPPHEPAVEAEPSAAATATHAANKPIGSSTVRAVDAVDLSSTATASDVKDCWKQFIYDHNDNGNCGDLEEQQQTQLVIAKRPAMTTVETLSRAISILESSANVAMLDFASPMSASASVSPLELAGFGSTMGMTMGGGVDGWPVGSPLMQHVSSESAWREQLFPMFLSFHLPNEIIRGCKSTTKSLRSRNWLLNLGDTSLDGAPALESAMTALCMARVGRRSNNMALVQHSLRLYTKGLRQLQDAIHDPATQLADQTLAACMAFSMYEVSECPSRHITGYYSHHSGGLALLKMRGPDAHITPLGHSLFVFMRMQQFIYALLLRKSNFLSDPEWTNRPWQTSVKDPQDKFMDQMYCVPVLLEQTDKLAESNLDAEALIRGYWDIIGQYHAIYRCLQGWHRDLQSIVAGPLFWPELSTIPCPVFDEIDKGRPFPVAFYFPAFSIGQSIMLFWVISMMVNHQIGTLHRRIIDLMSKSKGTAGTTGVWSEPSSPAPSSSGMSYSSSTPSSTESASSGSAASAPAESVPPIADYPPSIPVMLAAADEALSTTRTVTNNICQSIEYFLQDDMGDVGPLSMILPLTALRHVLCRMEPSKPYLPGPPGRPGEYSDEVVWVDFLIRYIGGTGQQLAFYLEDD